MRYREGQSPDPANPYTEGMHGTLMFTVGIALLVGVVLLYAGWKGKKLWLKAWSLGLVVCSLLYIALRLAGKA